MSVLSFMLGISVFNISLFLMYLVTRQRMYFVI